MWRHGAAAAVVLVLLQRIYCVFGDASSKASLSAGHQHVVIVSPIPRLASLCSKSTTRMVDWQTWLQRRVQRVRSDKPQLPACVSCILSVISRPNDERVRRFHVDSSDVAAAAAAAAWCDIPCVTRERSLTARTLSLVADRLSECRVTDQLCCSSCCWCYCVDKVMTCQQRRVERIKVADWRHVPRS